MHPVTNKSPESHIPRERRKANVMLFSAFILLWSMLDVFVAALLIVTIRLGTMANVEVHFGLYAFAGAVILTMVTTSKVLKLTDP